MPQQTFTQITQYVFSKITLRMFYNTPSKKLIKPTIENLSLFFFIPFFASHFAKQIFYFPRNSHSERTFSSCSIYRHQNKSGWRLRQPRPGGGSRPAGGRRDSPWLPPVSITFPAPSSSSNAYTVTQMEWMKDFARG